MYGMTFRNSRIVYYGPFNCEQCDALICRMGKEFGSNAFTYPEGPIYPNTEWHVHVCDPKNIAKKNARYAERRVQEKYPTAQAVFSQQQGWLIVAEDSPINLACAWPNSNSLSYFSDAESAWLAAYRRAFPGEDCSQ